MAALLRRGLRAAALLTVAPRRALAAWSGDTEPADPVLEEEQRARRRRAAARLRRLRRELGGQRGAPERTLTWAAMEQMRFLWQELPEEWPPERLARGFGVSPEEVRRVLRSRGCPPPHRRLRQDERAIAKAAAPRPAPGLSAGGEVRASDGSLLYRLPRGWGGPGDNAQ
ncbi:neugrin [Calypte anna]|uniref:neugrin n=1 Tax=Calypte anna TaxID=9244 RepID=UPI0011C41AF7|nr:neugrin [Calypte anna]